MNSQHNTAAPQISSPASTGGAGVYFEQHVSAAFLAYLLMRAIPPVLIDCQVTEVHLQAAHLGWHTDDILIVGTSSSGRRRRLAAQVKRTFTVSSNNTECCDTIVAAWQDFQRSDFSQGNDAFAIITQRGTDRLSHFINLLDYARAAVDADDFVNRLQLPGYLSKVATGFYSVIRTILDDYNKSGVDEAIVWEFLRTLHLLSLDLNTTASQTEAQIKTLLAATANDSDDIGGTEATWSKLLKLVTHSAPVAKSFTYDLLPEDLRKRHSPLPSSDHAALQALLDHSGRVLRAIRTTVGPSMHVQRDDLAAALLESLERDRVVVVSGTAGSGKSAVAKDALDLLARDHFVFALRADELAAPHIDEVIQKISSLHTTGRVLALLALQSRKVLLIESAERLLEKPVRDAAFDLLNIIRDDEHWRVIITCRDYSTETLRASFLQHCELPHSVVSIPLLDEEKVSQVISTFPKLERPAGNPSLRVLFRNLYTLDMAVRMEWPADAPVPDDERSFRRKVWQEIIREDHYAAYTMPQRRAEAFVQISLRRARSLDQYTPCDDLDTQALRSLSHSDLIRFHETTERLATPAHDVLEDWALMSWLDELAAIHQTHHPAFLAAIGTHPAVRRAYRKWLGELLECEPERTIQYVQSIIRDTALEQQSRDDTLVAVLLSTHAPDFIRDHETVLLSDDQNLLRRSIHLLRVACKRTPDGVNSAEGLASHSFVPDGVAWHAVLNVLRRNLDRFGDDDIPLVIGLLDDWTGGVTWENPYPLGAEDAARIAFALMERPALHGYDRKQQRKELLKVNAAIPNASENQFKQFIDSLIEKGPDDRLANEFAELVLSGIYGGRMCRDCPELVVRLAESQWYLDPNATDDDDRFYDHGWEKQFGLHRDLGADFSPASAYHGPFLKLLQFNPPIAFRFILNLLNRSVELYVASFGDNESFELPENISLTLPDGSVVEQWCSYRLWCLYRGSETGPHVLQCALMALERLLLELCTADVPVEGLLEYLLLNTNNVAITSVVASIAMAHPGKVGTVPLAFLSVPTLLGYDLRRMIGDRSPVSNMFKGWPGRDGVTRMYENERVESDALEHRKMPLEHLIVKLQIGPLRERIQQMLDEHKQNLPPVEHQSVEDKTWRLALHRMDLRNYHSTERLDDNRVVLETKPVEPDLQDFIEKDAPHFKEQSELMALYHWSHSCFNAGSPSKADPAEWKQRMAEAQHIQSLPKEQQSYFPWHMIVSSVAYMAFVCVRDYWEELSHTEREWCISIIAETVSRRPDSEFTHGENVDDVEAAVSILPLLLGKGLPAPIEHEIRNCLALGLAHRSDSVSLTTAQGIGRYLWTIDPTLAYASIAALVAGAEAIRLAVEREQSRLADDRVRGAWEDDRHEAIRAIFLEEKASETSSQFNFTLTEWWDTWAVGLLLPIVSNSTDTELSKRFFQHLSQAVVGSWDGDRSSNNRDFKLNRECIRALATYVLELPLPKAEEIITPFLEAIDRHPNEVADFIELLVVVVDKQSSRSQLWEIWQLFANAVPSAKWLKSLNSEYHRNDPLINQLFLELSWKADVRHWEHLDGEEYRIDQLFADLPPSAVVLKAYLQYLTGVGSQALPSAFVLLSQKLHAGESRSLISDSNVGYYLERLLTQFVYSNPVQLKSDAAIRVAVLHLLDELIEGGSSAAYRMRDDFVTPLPM